MTYQYLNTQALLKKHNIKPRKSLGQNFLTEPSGLHKVMEAAKLAEGDHVLEIGAGVGSLTYLLAQRAASVCAVEVDRGLIAPLREALAGKDNVRIIEGDMLALNPGEIMPHVGYQVVANIPYYITSALIRHLLAAEQKPTRITLTIQKEVAERIVAQDGKMSLLALSVHIFGKPEMAARIPAGCFFPAPDVDSAVLTIDLYDTPLVRPQDLDLFFSLARAGFSQKRKNLRNSLSGGMGIKTEETERMLEKAKVDPQRRAETLSISEWNALVAAWPAHENTDAPATQATA